MSELELKKAFAKLERHWPKDYWVFVASNTFTLMKKKNGERAIDPKTGGMAARYAVASFKIECDGGDW